MADWFPRATPPHPETRLRIETLQQAGRYGRVHVRAFDGDRWVYSSFYDCHRWDGHCGGQLLMPAFVEAAEAEAARLAWAANNENTRAPAGLSFTIEQRGEHRILVWPDNGCRPATAAECELWDALASAPASAPLPLTDQRILDLVTENAEGSGWLSKPGCWGALNRFARAIERECLAAAPVADERLLADLRHRAAFWRSPHVGDVPMRDATEDFARELDRAIAALSGPEPDSGSEGEEEGGTR